MQDNTECSASICELVSEYFIGTLDGHDKSKFVEHLKECSSCAAKLEKLQALHRSLQEALGQTYERNPPRSGWLETLMARLKDIEGD